MQTTDFEQRSIHISLKIDIYRRFLEDFEFGSALVGQADSTITEVVNAIRRVTDIMREISAASTEQS